MFPAGRPEADKLSGHEEKAPDRARWLLATEALSNAVGLRRGWWLPPAVLLVFQGCYWFKNRPVFGERGQERGSHWEELWVARGCS